MAEQSVYLAEKSLREAGDKISQEIKDAVNKKIEELKFVKDGEDIETIKSKTSELSLELQKIGQSMYNQNNDQQKPEEPGEQGGQEGQGEQK